MAITVTETAETYYDSFSRTNGVQRFVLAGDSGVNGSETIRAAVSGKQIFARGHIRVSGATVIYLYSASGGTVIGVLEYIAAGTQQIPRQVVTKAGELLEIKSTADVTVEGVIDTLEVAQGRPVPPGWL